MPEQQGDKSQEATPHRRRILREQGQVPKSQDLNSAILLLLGLVCLAMLGKSVTMWIEQLARESLGGQPWLEAAPDTVLAEAQRVLSGLVKHVLPIFGLMLAGAVLVNLVQTGPMFVPQRVLPDLTRIDPLRGVGRLFSLANAVRLVFGLFKVAVILAVAFVSLYADRSKILSLGGMTVLGGATLLVKVLFSITLKIAIALLILAILDFGFQRWKYEQDIRMTPQEVREELKNLEGNPQVIARRRAVQRQLALNRLSSAVPRADVVITNPTELAVAIQYDAETMAAPVVVAKGAGLLAQRIRQLALENGVPLVENKPLAQALFREVEVGHPIPEDKYAAVAEVLAYVYQLQGKPLPGVPRNAA